jgi:D-alanyl-D-alanine carboxypeptidase
LVAGLWEEAGRLRAARPITCLRDGKEGDLETFIQPSPLYGRRTFWVPKAAASAVRSLLQDAAAEGHPLYLTSAYRGAGYQSYLFLATLRQNAYCLTRTAQEVARPEESEHACLDRPAVDFGSLGDEGVPFETTDTYRWLESNATGRGFVLSYPKDNPQGMLHEPWHWKWTGSN